MFFLVSVIIILIIVLIMDSFLRKRKEKLDIEFRKKKIEFEQRELFKSYKNEVENSLNKLYNEKTTGFPWLANAISDYYENFDKIFAKYLETKTRPAYIQAQKIKEIAAEKKIFKKEFLISKYIIQYYESLFPWLREYVGFYSDDLIKSIYTENHSEEDPVSFYITKSEYKNLTVSERNQRALDRYWNRNKDPWQIGRDYERYIGYLYEKKGFKDFFT